MLASRRLQVPPAFLVPPLDGIGGLRAVAGRAEERHTALHDTEQLDLTRWRARIEHDPAYGWRVELPPVGEVPGAIHRVAGGPTMPDTLAERLWCLTDGRPLRRLVQLDIRAEVTLLLDDTPEEPVVALADEEVSVSDDDRLLARFRELVLRPGSGATGDLLDVVEAALLDAGATRLASGPSRFTEVFGRRAAAPPEIPDADTEPVGRPMAWVVARRLQAVVHRLVLAESHLRIGDDLAALASWHDDLCRLRAELAVWEPWLGPAVRDLRAPLTSLIDAVAPVRELAEVERAIAAATLRDVPDGGRGELAAEIAAELRAGRQRVEELLTSADTADLLGRLRRLGIAPPVRTEAAEVDPREVVRTTAATGFATLVSDVAEADVDTTSTSREELVDRLIVLADVGQHLDGKPARRFVRRARRYRRGLARRRRHGAAIAWLHARGSRPDRSSASAFLAGRLAGVEERNLQEAQGRTRRAWDRWTTPKGQRWIAEEPDRR